MTGITIPSVCSSIEAEHTVYDSHTSGGRPYDFDSVAVISIRPDKPDQGVRRLHPQAGTSVIPDRRARTIAERAVNGIPFRG